MLAIIPHTIAVTKMAIIMSIKFVDVQKSMVLSSFLTSELIDAEVFFQFLKGSALCHYCWVFKEFSQPKFVRFPIDHCHGLDSDL